MQRRETQSVFDGRENCIHRLSSGRRIGYAEFGATDGFPVLALHGTPGSRLMFALADEGARARGLRIIAPERAGYGLSDVHRYQSLADAARDVTALATALALPRFAVLGVSGGGPYAIAVAAENRDRTRLLALVSPVGPVAECGREVVMSRMHRLIFRRFARSPRACHAFFQSFRRLVLWAPGLAYRGLTHRVGPADRELLGRREVKASLQAAIREGLRTGVSGAVQDVRLFCGLWELPLGAIEVPAVLWQGTEDPIVPAEAAYRLARSLPNCRLEPLEGAGHYWVFGAFGLVLDALAAALR